ncbi:hypothetical protein NHP194003_16770 [Helicobacter suis]|uniref:Uncharacterized protein n=2 Tax=Helicobacter suis TaxID=104628 RepID=A0ABM7KXB3_9HELI|nr:hypothetical protein [Helicobacter suis]BCD45139.1 hypothetical protein NHP190020_01780 [Helicobacter suis]BCD48473.1 hypothetical protein NHP194003_16770 [Helicobacter suis]BCD50251.1 hypothetical protein NHP194004_16980 [Helicobacter suis]BCD51994.1 hypothetical protein NHP194022_16650 [Helicobacter suis]GFK17426.1 hypothetical protein NHP190033_16020 [Helicobacter suis]
MTQYIQNIGYLAVVKFNLDEAKKALVLLPKGAEVISLNLEIIEPLNATTTIDIGLDKAEDYFLNDIKADKKGFNQSSVLLHSNTNQSINATITNPAKVNKEVEPEPKENTEAKGKSKEVKPTEPKLGLAILRVHYFMPSQIQIEI